MTSATFIQSIDRIAHNVSKIEIALSEIEAKIAAHSDLRQDVTQTITEIDALLAAQDVEHG